MPPASATVSASLKSLGVSTGAGACPGVRVRGGQPVETDLQPSNGHGDGHGGGEDGF